MKKNLLFIAALLISTLSIAQKPEFMQTMGQTLGQYATCKSVADFQALGNKFQMIANVEKSEWLPVYYHAHCYIVMSFIDQNTEKKDVYLDEAEKSVDQLLTMVPRESEVYALQSFLFTARLVVNPMERGQKFSALSGEALGKALAIDPTNPRAKLLRLQGDMGSASFFGKDPKEFCPMAKELLANWDNFKPKSPFYPVWGKEQLVGIVKGCQ